MSSPATPKRPPPRKPRSGTEVPTSPTSPVVAASHASASSAPAEQKKPSAIEGFNRRRATTSFQAAALSLNPLANRTLGPRAMVIEELVLTENSYAKDLEVLLRHFILPIQKSRSASYAGKPILSADQEKIVFSNLTELLDIAYGVMNQLEQLKRQRASGHKYRVGDVLSIMANEFKAYTTYCINYPAAVEIVVSQRKGKVNPAFVEFEKVAFANAETERIDILGYLIKPVQRIMKYPLMIAELLKYTPPEHGEHRMLTKAKQRMDAVCKYIDERKGMVEQRSRLELLATRIDKLVGSGFDLVRTGRAVLMEFNAKVSLNPKKAPKALHHIWLFSDCVMICKTKSGGDAARAGDHMAPDDPYGNDTYKFVSRSFLSRLSIDIDSAHGTKAGHMFSMTDHPAAVTKKNPVVVITLCFEKALDLDKVFETLVTKVEQQRAKDLVQQQAQHLWDSLEPNTLTCVALYDHTSAGLYGDTELEFSKGDVIIVHAKSQSGGVWKGTVEGFNMFGIFPKEFVEPLDTDDEHIEFEETGSKQAEPAPLSLELTAGAKLPAPLPPPRNRINVRSRLERAGDEAVVQAVTQAESQANGASQDISVLSRKTMRKFRSESESLKRPSRPGRPARRVESAAYAPVVALTFPSAPAAVTPSDPTFVVRPEFPEEPKLISGYGVADDPNTAHRETMEDEWIILDGMGIYVPLASPAMLCNAAEKPDLIGGNVSYVGVYDGHGGRLTSDFVARNMHLLFRHRLLEVAFDIQQNRPSDSLWTEAEVKDVLVKTFMETDDAFLEMENNISGSTVAVAVICDARDSRNLAEPPVRWLISANVGDARVLLCGTDGRAQRLSYDHKATDENEVHRVNTESDGFIINDRVGGYLAITRAIGDRPLKAYGVIADPYTKAIKIPRTSTGPQRPFVIVACDGLFDVMSDQDAVDLVKAMACTETSPTGAQWMADRLVKEALTLGTKDNITVSVAVL